MLIAKVRCSQLDAIRAYDLAVSGEDDEIPFEAAITEIENSQQ